MKTILYSIGLFFFVWGTSVALKANDTVTTSSGLKYVITHKGKGRQPKEGNFVLVHYIGKLTDGKVFDSSRERNEPFAFTLGRKQVIKGWDEGIALLHIGDRATLIIPPDLGYGEKGSGKTIPPNATLIFDVELMEIHDASLGQALSETLDSKGLDAMLEQYARLKKENFKGIYKSESELNLLGYTLIRKEKVKEAIQVFKINVAEFPKSFNVYDSLAEAYLKDNQVDLAAANYRKSLELNPKNTNAIEALNGLQPLLEK